MNKQIFLVLAFTVIATAIDKEEECPIKGIPEIYSPVCANNGQTYDNIFLLKAANCDSETEIKLVSTGPCETIEKPAKKNSKKKAKRDTAVSKECPTVCTAFHAPICGDNGKTYSNKCQLDVESCQSGKKIKIVSTGNCPSNKTRRATKPGCPITYCPFNYDPVCGNDGISYSNECSLKAANCDSKRDIKLVTKGDCRRKKRSSDKPVSDCPVKFCTFNYAPVCGSDGVTYSNECTLRSANCDSKIEIKLVSEGSCDGAAGTDSGSSGSAPIDAETEYKSDKPGCPIDICTAQFAPVCGSDGKTYGNECALKAANCLAVGKDIVMVSKGSCDESNKPAPPAAAPSVVVKQGCPVENCNREYTPVCGDDGKTYPNECNLKDANCKAIGKDIRKATDGICVPASK